MARRACVSLGVILAVFGCWVATAAAQPESQSQSQAVSLALVLAVDVSTSVNDQRFELQRRGYAEAFTNPEIIRAIRATPRGQIAVTLFEWAAVDAQHVVVPWTVISDAEGGQLVAEQLLREPRSLRGWTSISGAIDFAARLLDANPYPPTRRVIDVSGDGVNNSGRPSANARDEAVARGITINGLPILSEAPPPGWRTPFGVPLDEFYRDNVIGGPGAFVVIAEDFDAFGAAILSKLIREISGLPASNGVAGLERAALRIAIVGSSGIRD
jgi:hypothetical protein